VLKVEGNVLWDRLSETAKDIIKRLMTPNALRRLTCAEALQHPWTKGKQEEEEEEEEKLASRWINSWLLLLYYGGGPRALTTDSWQVKDCQQNKSLTFFSFPPQA